MRKAGGIKRSLVEYSRKIARQHLVMGAMGNISAKKDETVWIKRKGVWLERARPGDYISVDIKSGRPLRRHAASKELYLHLGCYRSRSDVGAVVHTHPLMTTALVTAGVDINKVVPNINKIIGSRVVMLDYYRPGSKKLADQVRRAVKKADVVLLKNHGLVTVGKDVKEAYQRTVDCEREARKNIASLQK